ncbi:hypothetical protein [Balneatrix alpica]|uniref:Uncharacterized protein n=1 Tax=Balneatrix alpica TaxID=75684 RepID=A0ABV5ZDZ6_9GAMM|nr:hypothetical protein [Balneatrix alpica]
MPAGALARARASWKCLVQRPAQPTLVGRVRSFSLQDIHVELQHNLVPGEQIKLQVFAINHLGRRQELTLDCEYRSSLFLSNNPQVEVVLAFNHLAPQTRLFLESLL